MGKWKYSYDQCLLMRVHKLNHICNLIKMLIIIPWTSPIWKSALLPCFSYRCWTWALPLLPSFAASVAQTQSFASTSTINSLIIHYLRYLHSNCQSNSLIQPYFLLVAPIVFVYFIRSLLQCLLLLINHYFYSIEV